MISQKQLKVVDILKKNRNKWLSFNELKIFGGLKSNNFLQNSLNKFLEEEIVQQNKTGGSKTYKLKLFPKTTYYLTLLSYEEYEVPEEIIENIIQEVSKETVFFSVIIFGSYARKEQKKNSDIDMCIITKTVEESKEIEIRMKNIERRTVKKIHYYVFCEEDFRKMLDSEKENVGKEIARNHLVYYNPDAFYKIIEKWNQE